MLEIQLVRLFFEKRLIFEQRGIIDLSQLCQDELTQESSDRYENKGKAENSKKKNSNRGKTKKVIKKNPNCSECGAYQCRCFEDIFVQSIQSHPQIYGFEDLNNKFIADSFYRLDIVITNFFPKLSYMNINSAPSDDHVLAPNRFQNNLPIENLVRSTC